MRRPDEIFNEALDRELGPLRVELENTCGRWKRLRLRMRMNIRANQLRRAIYKSAKWLA